MHGYDLYMAFYIRLPARALYFSGKYNRAVVFCPCLKISIKARLDPVFVFEHRDLAVIRGDRLGNSAKVSDRIIVHPDPVAYITAGHAFNIEVITVRKGGNKNGNSRGIVRILPVMQAKGLSCVIQLKVNARMPRKVECNLFIVHPVSITPAELAVA